MMLIKGSLGVLTGCLRELDSVTPSLWRYKQEVAAGSKKPQLNLSFCFDIK